MVELQIVDLVVVFVKHSFFLLVCKVEDVIMH